jgi:hypothetical protein
MSTELLQAKKVPVEYSYLENILKQNPETYSQPSVIVLEPNGWFSTFLVDEKITVKTVDIYTYQCQSCENNMSCVHVEAVNDHILQGMELFAQACEIKRDMLPEMRQSIDKLNQHVELCQHAKEMKEQVQEMRQSIKKLRETVLRNM